MIYGVSGNEKRDIGYVKPKNFMFKLKPKKIVIKPKTLYSHFTYDHTDNIYSAQKPRVGKTFGRTYHKGSKNIRIHKNKIIYVTNILSSQVETPIMVPEFWMISTHDGLQELELNPGGSVGFGGNQKSKIIGSGTIGNGIIPSIINVLLVEGLIHNLLSISKLNDNAYDIIFNQQFRRTIS